MCVEGITPGSPGRCWDKSLSCTRPYHRYNPQRRSDVAVSFDASAANPIASASTPDSFHPGSGSDGIETLRGNASWCESRFEQWRYWWQLDSAGRRSSPMPVGARCGTTAHVPPHPARCRHARLLCMLWRRLRCVPAVLHHVPSPVVRGRHAGLQDSTELRTISMATVDWR